MRVVLALAVIVLGCSKKSEPPPKPLPPDAATMELVSIKDRGDKYAELRVKILDKDGKPLTYAPATLYKIKDYTCSGGPHGEVQGDTIVYPIGLDYCGLQHSENVTIEMKLDWGSRSGPPLMVTATMPTPSNIRASAEDLAKEADAKKDAALAKQKLRERMQWYASLAPIVPDPAKPTPSLTCFEADVKSVPGIPAVDHDVLVGSFKDLDTKLSGTPPFLFLNGGQVQQLLDFRYGTVHGDAPVDPVAVAKDLGTPPRIVKVYRAAQRAMPSASPDHTFAPGVFDGIVAFIDTDKKRVLCAASFKAESSSTVKGDELDGDFHNRFFDAAFAAERSLMPWLPRDAPVP